MDDVHLLSRAELAAHPAVRQASVSTRDRVLAGEFALSTERGLVALQGSPAEGYARGERLASPPAIPTRASAPTPAAASVVRAKVEPDPPTQESRFLSHAPVSALKSTPSSSLIAQRAREAAERAVQGVPDPEPNTVRGFCRTAPRPAASATPPASRREGSLIAARALAAARAAAAEPTTDTNSEPPSAA